MTWWLLLLLAAATLPAQNGTGRITPAGVARAQAVVDCGSPGNASSRA